MRLFGAPSEKLLQSYRDAAHIECPDGFLPIHANQLRCVRLRPERCNFSVTSQSANALPLGPEQIPISCFRPERYGFPLTTECVGWTYFQLPAASCSNDDIRITCYEQSAELTVPLNLPCPVSLQTPPLRYCQEPLITVDDARGWANRTACETPAARLLTVDLIDASDLGVRSLDPRSFDAPARRFSFTPPKDHITSTLFGQRPGRRGESFRVAPVSPPDPPPSLEKENLQERLRRLLTPPIHELLSDPELSLPHRPLPYQTYGIKWLYDRDSALLADEMGLGKTMQAIIAARLLWRAGSIKQVLIVCPKALIANWRKELSTWWAGVECFTRVVGQDRQSFFRLATKDVTVKIVNYEMVARELDWLREKRPPHDLVIIDEAQRIKNRTSRTAQAVKALDAKRRWSLTGTPLENTTDDLVSIFGFVRPGLINESDDQDRIRRAIKPYLLRRKQEEVLDDLPKLISQDIEVELGDQQREAYARAERAGIVELNAKGDTVTVTHVFALINKLRQICNFDPVSGQSAKTDLVLEEIEEILTSARKALIFGYFVDEPFGLRRLAKIIAAQKGFRNREAPLQLHGGISAPQRNSIVDKFQNDPAHQVLLANYAVGGVGLNLQAANYVFLFDRWWNPAWEDQAIKRAHRLGQKLPVFAKRLFCKGTIEERILKKLAEKRLLFASVIEGPDAGPSPASLGLSEDEIFDLFGLKVRPRRTSDTAGPIRVIIDNLDDREFEHLVAAVYERDGYKVEVTGGSHDGGIDVVAERVNAGGRDRIVVQCKHQKQNVGRPVLQQLWGVVHSDPSITRCDFVTSAGFSAEAHEFARGKRLTLIDRGKLKELAHRLGVAEIVEAASAQSARSGETAAPGSGPSSGGNTGAAASAKRDRSALDGWAPTRTLGEVRAKLKETGVFEGSWERFLAYLSLPIGAGLSKETTVAQARRVAG